VDMGCATGPTLDCEGGFWRKFSIVTFRTDGRVDGSGEANMHVN